MNASMRAVAGAGAHAGKRGVDAVRRRSRPRRRELATPEREVLVGVDADLGLGLEDVAVGAHPRSRTSFMVSAPAGVGDVDAVRAVGLHQLRLLRPAASGSVMWLIIRKPTTSMPSSRAVAMCWADDVGLGAVGGDAHRARRRGRRRACRSCDACRCRAAAGWSAVACLTTLGGGLDPLPVGVRAGAVVERSSRRGRRRGRPRWRRRRRRRGRAAMRHDLGRRCTVADGVHAVAQRDVLDVELGESWLVTRRPQSSALGDPLGRRAAPPRS